MYVINMKDLESQGVSSTEVKKSLQIECFDKIFRRTSDLPKKFKGKAFILCQELTNSGVHSFITETNYSFTVWKEELNIEEKINQQNNQNNNLLAVTSKSTVAKNNNSPSNYQVFVREQESAPAQIFESQDNTQEETSSIDQETVIEEKTNSKVHTAKRKTRTYRGITYQI